MLSALRWLPLGVTLPFLTLLPLARGLSLSAVGVVFAIHGVVVLVSEVPSGALADTVGRRRALVGGAALLAAALALFASATSMSGFAIAALALGAGRSLTSGALEAWFVDALRAVDPAAPLRPGLAGGLSLNSVALALGSLLGGAAPLLFSGLPSTGDDLVIRYSPAMAVAIGSALLYGLAVLALVDEPRPPARGGRSLRADLREVIAAAAEAVRLSGTVRAVLLVAFTAGIAVAACELLWQPRFVALTDDARPNTLLLGALAAAAMLAAAAAVRLGARASARVGVARVYVGGFIAAAAALGALAAADSVWAFCLAYVAFGAVFPLGEALHHEFLHNAVEGRARSTVASMESLALQLGAVTSNVGLAAVADGAGISSAWLIAAAVCVVGALFAARVASRAAEGDVRSQVDALAAP